MNVLNILICSSIFKFSLKVFTRLWKHLPFSSSFLIYNLICFHKPLKRAWQSQKERNSNLGEKNNIYVIFLAFFLSSGDFCSAVSINHLIKSTFILWKVAVWIKHCFVWIEAVTYWWPNLRVFSSKQQPFEEESLQVLVLWNHLLLHKPVCVPLHGLSFNPKQIKSFHLP